VLEFKDLVAMYFERSNAAQTLWLDYATIVLLLLGFLVAVKKPELTRSFRIALLCAFAGFAISNLWALKDVTQQREAIAQLAQSMEKNQLAPVLDPTSLYLVVPLHLGADLVVAAAIMFLGTRRGLQRNK
jgi:hypothetical protein